QGCLKRIKRKITLYEFLYLDCPYKENQKKLSIQTRSEFSSTESEKSTSELTSITSKMTTSSRAETSIFAAQCNVRRLDDYDDLINLNFEKEEEDNYIIVANPDNEQVLSLHNVVTNNRYENADYQEEYDESTSTLSTTPSPGAAGANPMRQLLKAVEFLIFSGEDQDLLTWLDEFDEACIANHITEAR
ncbi:42920_t:CDS:2, partial [Gigaspora margarita]